MHDRGVSRIGLIESSQGMREQATFFGGNGNVDGALAWGARRAYNPCRQFKPPLPVGYPYPTGMDGNLPVILAFDLSAGRVTLFAFFLAHVLGFFR